MIGLRIFSTTDGQQINTDSRKAHPQIFGGARLPTSRVCHVCGSRGRSPHQMAQLPNFDFMVFSF
jgi:hypothetical protein